MRAALTMMAEHRDRPVDCYRGGWYALRDTPLAKDGSPTSNEVAHSTLRALHARGLAWMSDRNSFVITAAGLAAVGARAAEEAKP
jgi:hypothetical protein